MQKVRRGERGRKKEKVRYAANLYQGTDLCDYLILREVSDSRILCAAYIVEEHSVALRGAAREQ